MNNINQINSNPKLILYVEDEDVQAKIFSKIIENEVSSHGFKVVVFKSGDDFIDLINSLHAKYKISEFGLILLDLSMHDVSGLAMLKEFKAKSIKTPIAILTAREDDELKNKALSIGANDYFVKGKDVEELSRLKNFILQSIN